MGSWEVWIQIKDIKSKDHRNDLNGAYFHDNHEGMQIKTNFVVFAQENGVSKDSWAYCWLLFNTQCCQLLPPLLPDWLDFAWIYLHLSPMARLRLWICLLREISLRGSLLCRNSAETRQEREEARTDGADFWNFFAIFNQSSVLGTDMRVCWLYRRNVGR